VFHIELGYCSGIIYDIDAGFIAKPVSHAYNLCNMGSLFDSIKKHSDSILQPNEADTPSGLKQLLTGTVLIHRYLIQEVIGIGGMGAVYCARDLHFQNAVKLVAIKEMINHAMDPDIRQTFVQNFEREANILGTLSHPSTPKIFDYFTEDSRSYLVMELISGKDLEKIIEETPDFLPVEQALAWGIQLCDVLEYLHGHKPEAIIFRDMKPSNIMINLYNQVVLVDFGIAKNFKTGQKGTMVGTEGYAPPEQYRGEATLAVDIYALGATLHHALSRRDPRLEPPFTFSERPLCKINPSVPRELEAIIYKALEYEPDKRYRTAKEMGEALVKTSQKISNFPKYVAYTGMISQKQLPRTIWKFQCEDEIRGSPSIYNDMIFIGSYDKNLYALNASNGQLLWKFAAEGGIVGQPLSTENSVYFGSEDHRLFAISTRTGKLSWAYETGAPIRSSPRIAEGHVFIGSDDGCMHAVSLLTTRRIWKTDVGAAIRSTPVIADGKIYFGCESGEFFCIDFRGQILWRFSARKGIISSPLVDKDLVFFTSMDANLYALDSKTGWQRWRYRLGKGSISSPCKEGNSIFTGAADGRIYAIEKANSKEIWNYQTGHQVSGSPVISDPYLFCGTADGKLYCLDARKGELKWAYETEGAITGFPVITGEKIYFGSMDHYLYALQFERSHESSLSK
jgi:eukaryotic-like serine/threonine-protein kinase